MMKRILTILFMCFVLATATTEVSLAQKTKKEKKKKKKKKDKKDKKSKKTSSNARKAVDDVKAWKKKLKKMDPLALKTLVDEKNELESTKTRVQTDLTEKRKQLIAKDEEINQLKSEKQTLISNASSGSIDTAKGIVFKVQIGAYEGIDITDQATGDTELGAEKSGNVKKYTLGAFKDYWSADKFKKYIRAMGLKDAWIVAYKDGKRVDVKDVLEEVI